MSTPCKVCGQTLTKIFVMEREKKLVALTPAEVTQYYQEQKYDEQHFICVRCANLCFFEIPPPEIMGKGFCVTCGGKHRLLTAQEENEYENKEYIYFRKAWKCWTCRDHVSQLNPANTCYITAPKIDNN